MVLYKREYASQISHSELTVLGIDGDQLYNGVKGLIVEHLEQLAEEKIVPTFPRTGSSYVNARSNAGGSSSYVTGGEAIERAMEGDRFLKAVKGVWEDHTGSMRKLKDILKYMVSGISSIFVSRHSRPTGQSAYRVCWRAQDIRRRLNLIPITHHSLEQAPSAHASYVDIAVASPAGTRRRSHHSVDGTRMRRYTATAQFQRKGRRCQCLYVGF